MYRQQDFCRFHARAEGAGGVEGMPQAGGCVSESSVYCSVLMCSERSARGGRQALCRDSVPVSCALVPHQSEW